jgi:D-inositol-3-phosphate glycosyltransferase
MNKPKILWCSDLVTPTGFARVSHSVLDTLKDKYDIVGLGVNYRGDPHPYPFPIYPAGAGKSVFGEDRLAAILNNTKFDLLYIINDSWIIHNYLDFLKKNVTVPLPKIVVYFPVDSENHDPEWYNNFHMVERAVTYTQFGVDVVNDKSCAPGLTLDIIPHGINQKVFYKKFTNRRDAKQLLVGQSKSPDSFVFLSANRNQPRKKLDITMEAFKLFAEGKQDVLLHMHCGARDAHIDVPKLSIRLGIDNKLILTNLNSGVQQVPDATLNDIYNAADVGLNSSLGEGWGLTSIEHAITGAPQIVPDHSACREVFSDCGLVVPTVTNITFDNSMTIGKIITPQAMAEKMNELYTNKKLYTELSEKSIAKFSLPKYSWKGIADQWDKLFQEVLIK